MMAAPFGTVDTRSAAEFRRPYDECVIQETAPFEVLEESGNGLIDSLGELGVLGHVGVGVPIVVGTAVDQLDEADAALGEAAGDQTLPAEARRVPARNAIQLKCFIRLARNLE